MHHCTMILQAKVFAELQVQRQPKFAPPKDTDVLQAEHQTTLQLCVPHKEAWHQHWLPQSVVSSIMHAKDISVSVCVGGGTQ